MMPSVNRYTWLMGMPVLSCRIRPRILVPITLHFRVHQNHGDGGRAHHSNLHHRSHDEKIQETVAAVTGIVVMLQHCHRYLAIRMRHVDRVNCCDKNNGCQSYQDDIPVSFDDCFCNGIIGHVRAPMVYIRLRPFSGAPTNATRFPNVSLPDSMSE